jgi:hypothetical protein
MAIFHQSPLSDWLFRSPVRCLTREFQPDRGDGGWVEGNVDQIHRGRPPATSAHKHRRSAALASTRFQQTLASDSVFS